MNVAEKNAFKGVVMWIIALIFTLLCSTFPLMRASTEMSAITDSDKILEDHQINMVLPINLITSVEYILLTALPKGFVSIQPLSSFANVNSDMIEFIPNGEDVDDWSEIISFHKYIGQKKSAHDFAKVVKEGMLKSVDNGKLWQENYFNKQAYRYANLGITYDLKGRHEIFAAQYYSGPADCIAVLYTIRPKKSESDAAVIAKLNSFFKNNIQVLEINKE